MRVVWISIAIVVVCFPTSRAIRKGLTAWERSTECGADWELRKGADKDLEMVAKYAGHVASQKFKFKQVDVVVRLIGGYIKDCTYPKYWIEAEFAPSNCSREEIGSFNPDDCVSPPGAPVKHCRIYLIVLRHSRKAHLVSYNCDEPEIIGPNWRPKMEMHHPEEPWRHGLGSSYEHGYYGTQPSQSFAGIGPFFLLFCAVLPVAGLFVLYKIW